MSLYYRTAIRIASIILIAASCIGAQPATQRKARIAPHVQVALDRISANSLRGHLSFIASDFLEGRNTPSRGLDTAALYIAAQFRRAGLEPAGDNGYFQTANWKVVERSGEGFALTLDGAGETVRVGFDRVSLPQGGGLDLNRVPVFKFDYNDAMALASLKSEDAEGKVIVTEMPDVRSMESSRRNEEYQRRAGLMEKMRALKPSVLVLIDRAGVAAASNAGRLIDPENPRPASAQQDIPTVTVYDRGFTAAFDAMKVGASGMTFSLRMPAPVERPVQLYNVIGVLRGSDPVLKDTCVIVSAHYDHIGKRIYGEGDQISNGANDDGSGTVSAIELANAFASLKQRPRRSIVFMTYFGEEKGLLGSRYYGRHPVFPIEKTVANINLEQIGRTDSTEGPQIGAVWPTGADFSDVMTIMKAAGELTGVKVLKHERNSDAYFGRSDNQALADQGVPAHTICVAFNYPDYHGVGDHWEKVDYDNMARVGRMIALTVWMIADSRIEPKWNEANPKTERYVRAWRERRAK